MSGRLPVVSGAELFAELGRETLKPLPATGYELATWKKVTVNIDYHVEYDLRFYSVPYQLVRQRLDLRATTTTVEVFRGGRRVASHPREHGRRRYVTDPATCPPPIGRTWSGHRAGSSPGRARSARRPPPSPRGSWRRDRIGEHAYCACLGLMNLARRYGNDRVGAASEQALASGAISYTAVKSILQENLDRLPASVPGAIPPPPAHDNLRGPGYYGEHDEANDAIVDNVGEADERGA